jgi:hypothetical protein
MGGEKVQDKFEPNTRIRGHLGAIIGQDCIYFKWSKLARWTRQNFQTID